MKTQTAGVARWYRIAMIGSIALPALLYAVVAWLTYSQALDEARERLERASRIAQEHAQRVVETNEVISRALLNAVDGLDDAQVDARHVELHAQFQRLAQGLPQLHSLWIWGADGRPLATSRFADPPAIDVSDREYFQWAQTHRGGGWFVSRPLVSRSTGELFFNFTKRREDADGRFRGAISVSLYPSFFVDFYRDLARREPGLAVSLVRTDGAIVASTSSTGRELEWSTDRQLMAALRTEAPWGEFSEPATLDEVARRLAYRRIERLPVYAVVILDTRTILADWRQDMAVLGAFAFPLALGLAFVCWLAKSNSLRLAAAVQAYRDEVDQRARAEEALRQAQKLEALGQITGGVAHDFNNVLMVVQTSNELARRLVAAGKDSTRAFASVDQAVKTGTQLTRQLLTFARRQPLQAAVVSLQQVMPPLLSLIQTTVGGAIRVKGGVDEACGPIHVDLAEFELALINLAVNARDAMPAGGVLTMVAMPDPAPPAEAAQATRHVLVTVADTGEGIAPDIRRRVFEPFFTTKRPGVGTGLGLSQVYGFATQAGGSVTLESTVGAGTTVTMRLPVTDAPPEQPGAVAATLPRLSGHLLLVEDNAAVAAALQPLLAQLGLEAEHVLSADDALAMLDTRADEFDVVLTDIVMPGSRTGFELAARVAERWPELPLVLMSGYAPELQRALVAGLVVLPKPCSPVALGAALERALEGRQSQPA